MSGPRLRARRRRARRRAGARPVRAPASGRATGRARRARLAAARRAGRPRRPGGPAAVHRAAGRRGPKPRWGRIALVAGVALLVLGLLGRRRLLLATRYGSTTTSTAPTRSPAITGGRPAKTVDGALNILLVGSDSRDPDANGDKAGEWRTDTMIVMHIPASHDKAYLVSHPARPLRARSRRARRDPRLRRHRGARSTRRSRGAACRWPCRPSRASPTCAWTTWWLIDFGGFKEVTDALGGVDMNVEQDITSIHQPYRTVHQGHQRT